MDVLVVEIADPYFCNLHHVNNEHESVIFAPFYSKNSQVRLLPIYTSERER